jgi:hypothetical protein
MTERTPDGQRPARHYTIGELAVVFAAFALTAMLLESEGLVTWASRLSLGSTQSALLSVLGPTHRALARVGLARPRRIAMRTVNQLAARYGPALSEAPSDLPDEPVQLLRMEPIEVVGVVPSVTSPDADANADSNADADVVADLVDDASGVNPDSEADPGAQSETASNPQATTELQAPDVPFPVPPSAPPEKHVHRRTVTVLLLGDSMMGLGLSGAITRTLSDEGHFRVVRAFKEATGLSRPDIYNWMEVLPPLLEESKPKLVVCTLGANDAQRIEEDGEVLEYGTRRWRAAYRTRVHELMTMLSAHGTEVLWLGLPTMRASDFNERMAKLNDIFESEANKVAHVHYLESASAVTGPDGAFVSFLSDESGQLVQLRMDDGIHYARAGGERVAQRVVNWINERTGATPVPASMPTPISTSSIPSPIPSPIPIPTAVPAAAGTVVVSASSSLPSSVSASTSNPGASSSSSPSSTATPTPTR